jgi:hypothetical protein
MQTLRRAFPLLLLVAATAAAQEEHLTDAQRDGFLGPVKSVSTQVSSPAVNWQQPAGPTLVTPVWCRDCDYDPDGTKTKSGQVVDGKFIGETIVVKRDGNGRVTDESFVNSTTGEVYRELRMGPFGRTEETDNLNGKVRWQQSFNYDPNGHMTDWLTLDSAGNQVGRVQTVAVSDGTVIDKSVWGKAGELQYRETFDPRTETESLNTYDEAGGVKLASIAMHRKPVSFSEALEATPQFGERFSFPQPNGDMDHYACHADGRCDRFAVHYEYLDPSKKRNPTIAEWRDAEDNLLYAAYFEYDLDALQNWTHRRVWVSAGQAKRALYEEDARTIAYWRN